MRIACAGVQVFTAVLLRAGRMSPLEGSRSAAFPSFVMLAFSVLMTVCRRFSTSVMGRGESLKRVQRDWTAGMILFTWLQIMQKRTLHVYCSTTRRRADCAARVIISASSRTVSLKKPGLVCRALVSAKVLICSQMMSMPRSSDALS